MNTENKNLYETYEHITLLKLYKNQSFRDKANRIIRGLKAPGNSGDYKYAHLQLLRLSSVAWAILVPLLIITILLFLPAQKALKYTQVHPVTLKPEPAPPPELDKIPPIEKHDETKNDDQVFSDYIYKLAPINPPATPDSTPNAQQDNLQNATTGQFISNNSHLIFKNLMPPFGKNGRQGGLDSGGGSAATENAVYNALRWLVMVQEVDGSWRQESGGGPGKGDAPAMTGLALLTFLAHGERTSSPQFGLTVQKGLQWLVNNQEPDGNFKGRDNHNYCLPIASYALCEAYGLTPTPDIKKAAEKSIKLIVDGQHESGGWDYNCKQSERDDTSYMGWCAQAIKAAYLAKMDVEGLDKALKKTNNGFKKNSHPKGGFGYTEPGQTHLTSVGVLCLQMLGSDRDIETLNGLMWLKNATCDWKNPWGKNPLYYWYYVTQAKFRASNDIWKEWNHMFASQVVNNQTILENAAPNNTDAGYWKHCSESEHCKSFVYNTTLCTLMLEVYYRELLSFKLQTESDGLPDYSSPSDIQVDIELSSTNNNNNQHIALTML